MYRAEMHKQCNELLGDAPSELIVLLHAIINALPEPQSDPHPSEVIHGFNCPKVIHDPVWPGYLHDDNDDTPYDVDGVKYCGRCHYAIARNLSSALVAPRAPEQPGEPFRPTPVSDAIRDAKIEALRELSNRWHSQEPFAGRLSVRKMIEKMIRELEAGK